MASGPDPAENLDKAVARVREAARSGARVICLPVLFYPTAIGWHPHEKEAFGAAQHDAWRTVQRGHAISNGVYVAVANRGGHEMPPSVTGQSAAAGQGAGGAGIEFWGSSFVADP